LTAFTLCSGGPKWNAILPYKACVNSGNNAATSCKNLVTLKFKRQESVIFAVTRLQFDDRLSFNILNQIGILQF